MADNSINQPDDSRRELYERFRSELADDRRGIYFDEEELVDIYDYAADMRDRFIAFEALLCGERLYPASAVLAERRALFCLDMDDFTGSAAVRQLPENSVIRSLAELRLSHPDRDTAVAELDRLLDLNPELTDEEILRLCDTAEELDLYPWLIANRDKIAAHTDYQPTFLYELAQIAQPHDPEQALKILEELTMIEPFSIDFWILSAQIHIGEQHYDKALAAIEYALAIDPSHTGALMLKAQVFHELDYPDDQLETVLRDVMAVDPDLPTPHLALAMLYGRSHDPHKAMNVLREYNATHPGNPQTLDVMLMIVAELPDEKLPELADYFLPGMNDDYADFIEMARRHADEGRHRPAAMLLLAIEKAIGLTDDFDYLMEELYRSGMYREAVEAYQSHFTRSKFVVQITIEELNDCFAAFWFILASIRSGITQGLAPLVGALIASQPVNGSRRTIDDILESRGLQEYLVKINAFLTGSDSLTPDDLDPFVEKPSLTINHEEETDSKE